jgi:hypothetical protein
MSTRPLGKMPDGQGVDFVRLRRKLLAFIDPMVGRGVQDQVGDMPVKHLFGLFPIGDIHVGMRHGDEIVVRIDLPQLLPQLAVCADQERPHRALRIPSRSA